MVTEEEGKKAFKFNDFLGEKSNKYRNKIAFYE